MSSYLERLKAKLHDEKPTPRELPRLPKPPFDSFDSDRGTRFSQTDGPATSTRYPLFYTDAEREAARLDARRLGYPGRTLH